MGGCAENLIGRVYGERTVVARAENTKQGSARFILKCACGTESVVRADELRAGRSLKCRPCHLTKHGQATRERKTSEYKIWRWMNERCRNPNNRAFKNYGGRGIKVCDEWRMSFQSFFDFLGSRPTPKHSIDRYPDNDGNYEPGNVRWATASQQRNNQRPPSTWRGRPVKRLQISARSA